MNDDKRLAINNTTTTTTATGNINSNNNNQKKPLKDQTTQAKVSKINKSSPNKNEIQAKNAAKNEASTADPQENQKKTVGDTNVPQKNQTQDSNKLRPLNSRDSLSELDLDPQILLNMDRLTPIIDEINAENTKEKLSNNQNSNKKKSITNKNSGKEIKQVTLPEKQPKNNRFSSIRQSKTNADILARDFTHDSYAEQYYAQSGYLAPWGQTTAYRQKLPLVPLNLMNDERLIKKRLELQLYDPLLAAESLMMKSSYGNLIEHEKLLEKWHHDRNKALLALKEHQISSYPNRVGNGYRDIHETDRSRLGSDSYYFPGRYTLKDYRKLKSNMGLGMSFLKQSELDPETIEEKRERLNRGKESGNSYMRILSKSRMSDTSPNGNHEQDYSDYENKLPTLNRVKKNYSTESANSLDKNSDEVLGKNINTTNNINNTKLYKNPRFRFGKNTDIPIENNARLRALDYSKANPVKTNA